MNARLIPPFRSTLADCLLKAFLLREHPQNRLSSQFSDLSFSLFLTTLPAPLRTLCASKRHAQCGLRVKDAWPSRPCPRPTNSQPLAE
jgi:hypothetical protein